VQDRAAAQKLGKEAERRIARARREFREQFNQTVVAHTTGADEGDENARPHVVARVSLGDTVQLKSIGRTGKVVRKLEGDALEVQVGPMKMRVPLMTSPPSSGRPPTIPSTPLAAKHQRPPP